MQQTELTFDPGLVTLVLTDSQRQQLEPLVRRQVKDRRGLLFVSVAPFLENGQTAFRLQAKFVPHRTANRLLRIIRECKADEAKTSL
jgi:hypothetical protein